MRCIQTAHDIQTIYTYLQVRTFKREARGLLDQGKYSPQYTIKQFSNIEHCRTVQQYSVNITMVQYRTMQQSSYITIYKNKTIIFFLEYIHRGIVIGNTPIQNGSMIPENTIRVHGYLIIYTNNLPSGSYTQGQ